MISDADTRGMSPGIVIMPAWPSRDQQARSGRNGAGMAFPRALRDDPRAVAAGERRRNRIDGHEKDAGKLRDRAQGVEDILEHDRRERATLLRAQA